MAVFHKFIFDTTKFPEHNIKKFMYKRGIGGFKIKRENEFIILELAKLRDSIIEKPVLNPPDGMPIPGITMILTT